MYVTYRKKQSRAISAEGVYNDRIYMFTCVERQATTKSVVKLSVL